jgi:LPXTG-site transpeptidase (sortase) family protein
MRAAGAVQGALFAVAVASLGSAGFIVIDARMFDARERDKARAWMGRGSDPDPLPVRADQPSQSRRLAQAGESWGRLEAEHLGLSAAVIEGVEPRALRRAVGHVPGTAFPGEAGNVVLAGHRDMHFRPLHDAKPGDELRLVTPDGIFVYGIDSTDVVGPFDTEVMEPTPVPQLTLITCYPFSFVGPAPQRYVVRAALRQRM